jgi:hypothetical protein
VEGWELQSDGSNDSLSPLEDYDLDDTSSSIGSEELNAIESPTVPVDPAAEERRKQELQKLLDEVQATQRWRSDLRSVVPPRRHFDIGDPLTLGRCGHCTHMKRFQAIPHLLQDHLSSVFSAGPYLQ